MKSTSSMQFQAKSPKTVIQIISRETRYLKGTGPTPFTPPRIDTPNRAGFAVREGVLLLPESERANIENREFSHLVITDRFVCREPAAPEIGSDYHYCTIGPAGIAVDIFRIHRNGADYDLWLDGGRARTSLGAPTRRTYRTAILRNELPVRISINGKSDFTLSGRMPRTFCEREYLIRIVGYFSAFGFAADAAGTAEEPAQVKHVDLREILR